MTDDRLSELEQKTRYIPGEVEERIFDQWLGA